MQTFLAQKYGYRPFPPKIEADEFESILASLAEEDDRRLLSVWFQRDDNMLPPHYILQPIREELPDYTNDAKPDKKKVVRSNVITQWPNGGIASIYDLYIDICTGVDKEIDTT